MRAIFYYIFLSFLLLCGGNYSYANTNHDATTHFSFKSPDKKQQLTHKRSNHHSLLIESTDVMDEEFHTEVDFDYKGSNAVLANYQNLQNGWYIAFANQFIFKTISANNKFFEPSSGSFNPIYLRIGILRI